MRALAALTCLALAACADFPQVEATGRDLGPAGPPPPLLPFDQLQAATSGRASAPQTGNLDARAAALNARAAILRAPVDDPGDIDDLRARLARLR